MWARRHACKPPQKKKPSLIKSKVELDAEATNKMAYKKATVVGPYISRKVSNRDNPLAGHVAVRQSEAAIAGLLSTKKP